MDYIIIGLILATGYTLGLLHALVIYRARVDRRESELREIVSKGR